MLNTRDSKRFFLFPIIEEKLSLLSAMLAVAIFYLPFIKVWRKPGTKFQEFSPRGVPWMCLIPPAVVGTRHMKRCFPGKLRRGSVPAVFIEGTLPGTYQRSRLPEGGQVCGTDHMVCTDNLSTPSHSHLSLSLPIFHIQFRIFPSFYCDFFL